MDLTSLPGDVKELVRAQFEAGHFPSVDEVVCEVRELRGMTNRWGSPGQSDPRRGVQAARGEPGLHCPTSLRAPKPPALPASSPTVLSPESVKRLIDAIFCVLRSL